MAHFTLSDHPHRRHNPLRGDWILVSPHRTKRPWQGQIEKPPQETRPSYDPACYLCPGNARAGGNENPVYTETFVFDNDFAALLPDSPSGQWQGHHLLRAEGEPGLCRVVCFSPDHSLTLAQMTPDQILRVVEVWTEQYREIGSRPEINYVQIFENKGAMMGCSNPHPHGQIWANATVPQEPALEQRNQVAYRQQHGSCLLCDYQALEVGLDERVVCANEHLVAVVPFWATWPFEAMIIPRRHVRDLTELDADERFAVAEILSELTIRYDNLFETSFPYTMGLHQCPTDGQGHPEWHLHWHFYPPLLRSATVRKFMVGYEMLATPQRDLTAESAAERLRELAAVRYDRA